MKSIDVENTLMSHQTTGDTGLTKRESHVQYLERLIAKELEAKIVLSIIVLNLHQKEISGFKDETDHLYSTRRFPDIHNL